MTSQTELGFAERVVGAASQGAAGALVAASLSSVTEPVVNRVLVRRMTLTEAIADVKFEAISKFFNTTVTTNFIKFPFFEVVSMLLGDVQLPGAVKGAMLGAVFTTATLPITNYRYCKSVGQPVDSGALYKAYIPTVLRDIVYGICRNNVYAALLQAKPQWGETVQGRAILMGITVLVSCVVSAPGNEVRGYYLQPPNRRLPVKEFFKPERFVRSTSVGALIMSVALAVGTLATAPVSTQVQKIKEHLAANPTSRALLSLFLLSQLFQSRRHSQVLAKMDETAYKPSEVLEEKKSA